MNLKEFSKVMGLSQTTISRALNGYPEVSEATRERVAQAAAQHNYRPNTRAQSLATGRAHAIGHIIPMSTKHEMVNPIFGDFIAGAGETYAKAGFEMILSMVDDQNQEFAYRKLQSRGSVDGVVVHGPQRNDPRIEFLQKIGMPFVVHGRSSGHDGDYSWLDVNNRGAFHRATNFLLDLGHRRIGLINGLEALDFAHRRRQGYSEALSERGISIDEALMRSDEMTEIYGHHAALDMLNSDAPPTAFLVSSMIAALGTRRAIEEMGLKMGRDVSVVTHDDALSYLQNGDDIPIFSATRSSVREAGQRLAQMLLTQIQSDSCEAQHVLLEAELVVGGSTGPAPIQD